MNLIEKTGQTDRQNRANAIQAAGAGVMFGSIVSGSLVLLPVGIVSFFATMLYQWNAIRCPRCGYNLSWHAVTRKEVGQSASWLQTAKACPRCGLGEEGSATARSAGLAAVATQAETAAADPVGVPLPPGAFAEPPPDAPWRLALGPVGKPYWSDYGYIEAGRMVGCTREELLRRFEGGGMVLMVWTPDTPRPTWFENVPELLDRYRAGRMAAGRRGYWGPLAFLVTVLVGMLTSGEPVTLGGGPAFWLAGSALLLGIRLYMRRSAMRLDAAAVRHELDDAWHAGWLRGQPAQLTKVLIGSMIGVFVAQGLSTGSSANAAGMLPEAVRHGEWWRLLSYGVLHAHPLHIGLNLLALWSLGKLMEVHANRALLSPVLLAGIVGGGLIGLVMGPDIPMVGVSGGLLAVIGFLAVVGFRRRERVPHGFGASMLKDVAFVAAVGLVGFRMIANAGHLGGLLAGVALGALLVPRPHDEPRVGWAVGPVMTAVGWICTGVLVATCAATALYLFVAPH
ncbi:MAG TPA: rhomboid family intramembrane serine protease [Longimicrobium sp.]|nr:rhomboid family intramembrane serine protease [Longimicrobium sp.]